MTNKSNTKIDFLPYINERTRDFAGREWLFEEIGAWLDDPYAERFFLLTGEPGSGKSTIAARLAQFSLGEVTNGALAPDFLSAFHFCSARERRWINSTVFAESLALQLSGRYPVYAEALTEKSGQRQVNLNVTQTARSMSGQMTGIVIKELNLSGMSAEDVFVRIVREPLEVLCDQAPDTPIVILVDALDESLGYRGTNIVSLLAESEDLPDNVRFILTSRKVDEIESDFSDANGLFLSSFNKNNQQDLVAYLERQMSHNEKLAAKVAQFDIQQRADWVTQIVSQAEDNFLYLTFLLAEMAEGQRPLSTLAGLPKGLDGLYHQSLKRVVKLGQEKWSDKYAPLMGLLSVAQGNLMFPQLQAFTGQSKEALNNAITDLEQFIEQVEVSNASEEVEYRLYHQSAIDFLRKRHLKINAKRISNRYYLSAETWHGQIIEASRPASGKWVDLPASDSYLWDHLGDHLCGAELEETLGQLLLDFDWVQAKLNATDINALLADYELYLAKRAQVSSEGQEEDDVNLLERTLRHAAHVLVEDESQLVGQLWARLPSHSAPAVQRLLQQAADSPAMLRLRPLLPFLQESSALIRSLTGHTNYVAAVAVSPDGRLIISANYDDTLKVWDLASGDLLKTLTGHTSTVTGVAVTPDGQRIISASLDKTVKVWELASGDLLKSLTGHTDIVYGVAVSPDGQRIISASSDQTVKVWDLASGDLLKTLTGHTQPVYGVAVSPDGQRIISASSDETLKVWDLASGDLLKTLTGHTSIVGGVAVSPDGQRIISASSDKTLKVWELASGDLLKTLTGHTEEVAGVAVSPNGQRIISASYDKTLKVWDLTSGDLLKTLTGHTDIVHKLAVSPDGQRIISTSEDETVKVWELASGDLLKTFTGHTESVYGVAAVGQWIILISRGGTLKVWNLEADQCLTEFNFNEPGLTCAVAPDGQTIVAGGSSGRVHSLRLEGELVAN